MKKIFLLLMLSTVGIMQSWAGSTYYAQLTAKSGNENMGNVYAGIEKTSSPNYATTSTSDSQESGSASSELTFYAYYSANPGYHFVSWTADANVFSTSGTQPCTVVVKSSSTGNGTNTGTVTANFAANTYTVAYDANGGKGTMESKSHTYGTPFTLAKNTFTKYGYEFAEWNTKADGTGTSYSDVANVNIATTNDNETVTLYAQWKQTKVSANMYIRTALGCATFCAPFDVEIPTDVKAYTASEVEGDWLKMEEITTGTIAAYTPVVVYYSGSEDLNLTFSGYIAEGSESAGILTGNYTGSVDYVPANSFVLQRNNEITGWYKVESDNTIKVGSCRCYMTKPAGAARAYYVMSFDEATGIYSIATEAAAKADGKYLVNGKIVIMKNGKAYNINGTIVK